MLDVLSTVRMLDKRLRNIESDSIITLESDVQRVRRGRLSSDEVESDLQRVRKGGRGINADIVKRKIYQCLNENMTHSQIIELLQVEGVPSTFVIEEIYKIVGAKASNS